MALTIGIILLLTFIGFIVYAVKGGNLMIGFLVMAVIWSTLGMIGGEITWDQAMTQIFQGGPESWGPTAVVVVFGSWFGQVLVKTGVASKIIRMTVELGGDKPLITTVLLSVVTGLIFTSTFGAGAVVAIGVIVLPILLSLGVPKSLAVSSYIMSVGSGMYVNIVLFKQMQAIFTDFAYDGNYLKFGFTAMAVQILIVILMLSVRLRKSKVSRAWAATASSSDNQNVPAIALITPLIPVVLAIGFDWQPIPAFIVAALFALFVTGKIRSYKDAEKVISKTFYDGVVDVAGLLGFLFILPMFNKVSGAVSPFFESILGGIMPTSTLTVAILFMVIAPLGLFRGPLTVFGAGAATIGILTGVGDFPLAFLFPLMYIPTISMNISACPTQSWNLWSINYTKTDTRSFLLSGVPWAWGVCIINIAIAYLMFG
ncbi:citrate transporter [Bacillus sp. FJAT-27225]|uniref:citrate transporter n=1 Tax=Bacillus sp. FJAT-27225 TaxID=1743144 RepID=UPI00080C26B2|nr:citrate transporter [Bacillus sp. FJAT-27225]OCA85934.1 citrate transporter [Bacillus sp. FJAT-27225]